MTKRKELVPINYSPERLARLQAEYDDPRQWESPGGGKAREFLYSVLRYHRAMTFVTEKQAEGVQKVMVFNENYRAGHGIPPPPEPPNIRLVPTIPSAPLVTKAVPVVGRPKYPKTPKALTAPPIVQEPTPPAASDTPTDTKEPVMPAPKIPLPDLAASGLDWDPPVNMRYMANGWRFKTGTVLRTLQELPDFPAPINAEAIKQKKETFALWRYSDIKAWGDAHKADIEKSRRHSEHGPGSVAAAGQTEVGLLLDKLEAETAKRADVETRLAALEALIAGKTGTGA